jgi:hypothetical protein
MTARSIIIIINYERRKSRGKRHTFSHINFKSHRDLFCWGKDINNYSNQNNKVKPNFEISNNIRKIPCNPNGNIIEWDTDIHRSRQVNLCDNGRKKRRDPNFSYEPNAIFEKKQ